MTGKGKPRRKTPAAAKGHKLPDPINEGLEVQDTVKKGWVFGKQIGSGGFGTVYYASEVGKKDFDYVIKVEYHGNGPLFAEMHCYQNIGKPAHLAAWTKKQKLSYLGLSPCYGFGSFEFQGSKYRFMVIERFGVDLQKLFEENDRRFPLTAVYRIGIDLLNVLEYIHSTGYIHGDVKGANLLLGRTQRTQNQVYLVDMGLACKFLRGEDHKKEAPDPKKAHNGTPEFTSRDAHRGCFSRRSDLEILCYNLLQWLSGELPWEPFITDNKKLQQEKEKFMKDIDSFFDVLFGNNDHPSGIKNLLTYVTQLEFEEDPDYNFCRKVLGEELKKMGRDKDLDLQVLLKKKASSKPVKEQVSNKENAKVPKSSQEKRKPETSALVLEPGVIPTPAMLEIMNKRAEEQKKPAKTRRKK